MQIVRFNYKSETKYGILDNNLISGLSGDPFQYFQIGAAFKKDGSSYPLSGVKLLSPCLPSKLVCLGLNYRPHAQEFNLALPSEPLLFIKPSTAVIGPEQAIVLPQNYQRVDYECELAVVIGKTAKQVPENRARDYILGYTCFNDVTERHIQKKDVQWTRAKSFDTFAPIGPWIETELEPEDLKLETCLNGQIRQSARTSELIFSITYLISFISGVMTLLPGDVIATGTPGGIGPMKAGDIVEIKIEQIGTLRNRVELAV
jgi:2-keto-4-pentenoate hydratase/2-oxohepta-3-ene-1,7-dioic acid hydratase in catechol pathway